MLTLDGGGRPPPPTPVAAATDSSMIIDAALPPLLIRISFLGALLSISSYCILVATGDYAKWSYPILIGAAICKLTFVTTATRWQNYENSNGTFSSSYFNTNLSNCCFSDGLLRSLYKSITHRISNDNHQHNLKILSTAIILLPCFIFYISRVIRHLSELTDDGHYNHDELANDFGKLSAAFLSFLLIPVSKHSALFSSLNLGEIHVVRIHIYAGTCATVAGVAHGLYYAWIWIVMDGYTYRDVFPGSECFQKGYDKDCHTQFVNLLGIMNGVGFVILGCTALWWVRRHYYNIFYYIHIVLAIALLLGLVMHYNKMIWFIAPSLLYYLASNVPAAFESLYKWSKGGVGISKVVCIPDSRGCVELTIARNNNYSSEVRGGWEGDKSQAYAIGKYARLTVPEISSKSHPFTAFCDPLHPQNLKILFRPIGTFTTQLSKRLESLVTSPELTPSELTMSNDTRLCPKILVNGVSTSSDLLGQAMRHDNIIIIAGGVGIVPYISLLSALNDFGLEHLNNDGEQSHIQKTRHIHVHWVSRDEGLIRFVVENYLSLHHHESNSAITVSVSVHHTNEQASSMPSTSHNNELDTLIQFVAPPEIARSSASPTSLYEGSKRTLFQNVLPVSVFASIVLGGLWIVNYCYENIQDKHVIETRPVSVIGIIVWSVVVSIGSLALVKMTEALSRVVVYSKLERDACEENDIECGVISQDSTDTDRFTIDDMSRRDDEAQQQQMESASVQNGEENHGLGASISHLQGRPDLESIITDAFESARDEQTDIGVFMCGPSSLTDAASRAITNIEERCGFCLANTLSHEPRAYVYQEMFET